MAEKVSALDAESYLVERTRRANLDSYFQAMARVPDIAAEGQDSVPDDLKKLFSK